MKTSDIITLVIGGIVLLWAVNILRAQNALSAAQGSSAAFWGALGNDLNSNDTSILNGDNSLIPSVPLENYLPELDPTYS